MWFNYWGLIILTIIMIPNIIFAIKNKNGFENKYCGKIVLALEQIGRYGSMAFMVFSIPFVSMGF